MLRLNRYKIGWGIFFSVILTGAFLQLADFETKKVEFKQEEDIKTASPVFVKKIFLNRKSEYILQLKYRSPETEGEAVTFNGHRLEMRGGNTSKNLVTVHYYYIPQHISETGNGELKISFYPVKPAYFDVRLTNYLVALNHGNVLLTLKNARIVIEKRYVLWAMAAVFFFFSVFLWIMLMSLAADFFNFPEGAALFVCIVSFLPVTGMLSFVAVTSFYGPYSMIVEWSYLCLAVFLIVSATGIFLNFLLLWCLRPGDLSGDYRNKIMNRGKYVVPAWFKRTTSWLGAQRVSDKLIIMFAVLFSLCSVLLAFGLKNAAEKLGNVAYYVLAGGLLARITGSRGNEKKP
ncbi:MAG: hypothetical protein PHO30_00380 [Candidatus Omnitrophica bacterium]|nr:hypothetical protein [Candidatus Omnitrophota bacterium]